MIGFYVLTWFWLNIWYKFYLIYFAKMQVIIIGIRISHFSGLNFFYIFFRWWIYVQWMIGWSIGISNIRIWIFAKMIFWTALICKSLPTVYSVSTLIPFRKSWCILPFHRIVIPSDNDCSTHSRTLRSR